MDKRELEELWARPTPRPNPLRTVYEIIFVTVAVINYILVLFDALYLYPLPYYRLTPRDLLLETAPAAVALVDPVKGIEPHRFTVSFEEDYTNLKQAFADRSTAPPTDVLAADKRIDTLIASLAQKSTEMIDRRGVESHFYMAEKDGVLEMIKNSIRRQVPNKENSAKQSFSTFFSRENLSDSRRGDQFAFFDKEILPLLKENYFRWIGEDGKKTEFFYRYDRWFVLFFALDFLVRWISALYTKRYRRWYLFAIHHAFDLFLLYPPHHSAVLRLLRIIPIYIRMKRNRFVPDDGVMPNIIHNNAQIIAQEISSLVAMNILEEVRRSLDESGRLAISAETTDAIERLLAGRLDAFSHRVMPEIEPAITEMVQYSINRAMEPYLLSPIGPIVRLILLNVHSAVREGLEAALSGPEGTERLSQILRKSVHGILTDITSSAMQDALIADVSALLRGLQSDLESEMKRQAESRDGNGRHHEYPEAGGATA